MSRGKRESLEVDIMTHGLVEYRVHQGRLATRAYRVQRENPSSALLDPRDLQGHQESVTMAALVPQDHLDLQGPRGLPHFLEHTGPIIPSVSLDLLVPQAPLGTLVCPLGLQF